MYKWPQGRLIRIICLILSLLIAADLGYTGAYAKFAAVSGQSSSDHGQLRMIVLGSIFAVASATALIGGIIAAGFHKRAVQFLIDVEHEMTLVEWPTMRVLFRSTLVIAIVMVVLAAVIVGVDIVNHYLLFNVLFTLGDKI
jgi:preprotein translocase SecE subunit